MQRVLDPLLEGPQLVSPASPTIIPAKLSPVLAQILREVQRELGYGEIELDRGALRALVDRTAERLGFDLVALERDEILAQIEREAKPFGLLQPLVDNPEVTDIIVTNFARVCLQQGRRNFTTDISFPSQEAYEAFVERLLQRAGSSYSTKRPIADGMIGSNARVHVVHRSLCESGPYLTIRLNRFSTVRTEDLLESGMAPRELLHYLQGMVRIGATLLIAGEVGTGKTTLSRALAGSIPTDESILVIEDTPEIRLEHPHVRYVHTREANTDGEGRVTPQECIRGGMRMAMNRIIFGEIRDAEAAEAFVDVCASGHPGISTVHARSAGEALVRLELFLGRSQRGVMRNVLTEQLVTAVQAIVHVGICRETGRRRVLEVKEVGPVADGVIRQRDIFKYQPQNGVPQWRVLNRVSAHREELESLADAVRLSAFPAVLEEEIDLARAAQQHRAMPQSPFHSVRG